MTTQTAPQSLTLRATQNVRREVAAYDISATDIAGMLPLSAASVRRRLRGELPWSLEELDAVAKLVRDHAPDFDASTFTRP